MGVTDFAKERFGDDSCHNRHMSEGRVQRLQRVAAALERTSTALAGSPATEIRRRILRELAEYTIPRLVDSSAGLVVAFIGPSGSGKSTLVNSVARRRISGAGALRPTTIEPVAWTDGALPATLNGLRSRMPGRIVDSLRPPPEGIAVVDTPPPDVTTDGGEPIAEQILAVADAAVFVASGVRYADSGGFGLLESAVARAMPVVYVLNRLPSTPEMQQLLAADFASKLHGRGLLERAAGELIVPVAEGPVTDFDVLPADWVSGLRKELEVLAEPLNRIALAKEGVEASLARVDEGLSRLRRHVVDGEAARIELLDPVRSAYRREAEVLREQLERGGLAGVGDPGDRMDDDLASIATRRAGRAARISAARWEEHPAGVLLLDAQGSLFTHGPDTLAEARHRIGWWRSDLVHLVGQARGKRFGARRGRLISEALARKALDHRVPLRRGHRRHLGEAVIAAARSRLADELEGILDLDGGRFLAAVGGAPPDGILNILRGTDD